MMSAFRGRPRQSEGYRGLPLIKLIEEYLMQNSHQYLVNMEDMGEFIRRRSFRFSRMKMPVFKEQLQRAYQAYTDAQQDPNMPEEAIPEMEEDDSDQSSDSFDAGWKIDESSVNSVGADQKKNLYMPGSSNGTMEARASTENDGEVAEVVEAENVDSSRKQDSLDCISVNSSVSTQSKKKSVSPAKTTLEVDDDSGSDLEIIGEVHVIETSSHAPRANNPTNSVIMQTKQNGVSQSVKILQPSKEKVPDNRSAFTPAQNVAPRHQTPNPKVSLQPDNNGSTPSRPQPSKFPINKGTKRKPESAEDTGINEDLTRKRSKKEISIVRNTGFKLNDFAGSEKAVEEVCKLLMHLKHPEIYRTLGVTPPRGFLLHGPPGTGKTLLTNAIAGELELPMLKVAGTELVSGISGESESNIRDLFNQAVGAAPCIVFIDEIDSVTPKRENVNKEMERRIVAQLLACIDDLGNKEKGDQVLLVGATNRVEAIDTALRRAGRFDREICLGIPDEKSRAKILSVICRDLRLEPEFSLTSLARFTPGYVGADLQALAREAAVQAVNRQIILDKTKPVANDEKDIKEEKMEVVPSEEPVQIQTEEEKESNVDVNQSKHNPLSWIKETSPLSEEELTNLYVTMKDFEFALKNVQPSSKREGFATVPDTTWDDIGALHEIRDELQVSIMGPVKHAEAFQKLGLTTPAGVLLCGPPGCGKTLLAKAVANEAGINFISVKGPELLNMYVGESERAVRQCFMRARNSSPCVIFFDELDALCPRRSEIADSGSGGRIVNQLLTEMDGMEARLGVFVMAATNRPDIIDPAILRPGRLDKILFVNLPAAKDRHEILKAITKNSTRPVLDEDVSLEEIANSPECENYTGADLSALVREASIAAFRELVLSNKDGDSPRDLKVYRRHFDTAFAKTKPSVSKEDRAKYSLMAEKYSSYR